MKNAAVAAIAPISAMMMSGTQRPRRPRPNGNLASKSGGEVT
jgi:hypothetical protein